MSELLYFTLCGYDIPEKEENLLETYNFSCVFRKKS